MKAFYLPPNEPLQVPSFGMFTGFIEGSKGVHSVTMAKDGVVVKLKNKNGAEATVRIVAGGRYVETKEIDNGNV